ncbi:MAG: Hsp70 family protein [Deltaproteobacteria bacterium]|nr:Hsp70 family protein [Deltaproteobacteria bacterium]
MADLTIDLGNYNTIITFREPKAEIHGLLRGTAREIQGFPGALFVPSLIHVGEEVVVGEEVLRRDLYGAEGTFRDLKDHLLHPTPVGRMLGGQRVTHKMAGATFLAALTQKVKEGLGESLHVVLLFPSAEGDAYREWLRTLSLPAASSVTLVDEDTAVALGYGVNLFFDDLLMVFDFGFSSVRARILQFHWLGRDAYGPPVVKAAASLPVGTADLKQKILRALHADATEGPLPSFVWKKFSLHDEGESLSHEKFQQMLERENLAASVQRAIDMALEEARLEGVEKAQIRKVLLIGGGTRIPIVHLTLEENFGDRVQGELPEIAAGRGGIAFLSDSPIDDMVRQAYAIQMRDPITGEYHYPAVVPRYTRYPTRSPTARYIVNTFYDGQYELQLRLFRTTGAGDAPGSREILFGEDGKISFVGASNQEAHEAVPDAVFTIPVDPPGRIGERRFLLEFAIDNQKRLVVTVRDLREEKVVWAEKPLTTLS